MDLTVDGAKITGLLGTRVVPSLVGRVEFGRLLPTATVPAPDSQLPFKQKPAETPQVVAGAGYRPFCDAKPCPGRAWWNSKLKLVQALKRLGFMRTNPENMNF